MVPMALALSEQLCGKSEEGKICMPITTAIHGSVSYTQISARNTSATAPPQHQIPYSLFYPLVSLCKLRSIDFRKAVFWKARV